MKVSTDIDIDFFDRDSALKHFKHIPASMRKGNEIVPHKSGVYFHDIPYDQLSGLSTIPYKEAEERNYFKVDFLNNRLYEGIKDETHLDSLLEREPIWELLEEKEIVSQLAHIHQHYHIVSLLKPRSIEQLAAVLAVIRPAKSHLINQGWEKINSEVWIKPEDDSYYFKRAHAIAYATGIAVQLNFLCEQAELNASLSSSV